MNTIWSKEIELQFTYNYMYFLCTFNRWWRVLFSFHKIRLEVFELKHIFQKVLYHWFFLRLLLLLLRQRLLCSVLILTSFLGRIFDKFWLEIKLDHQMNQSKIFFKNLDRHGKKNYEKFWVLRTLLFTSVKRT